MHIRPQWKTIWRVLLLVMAAFAGSLLLLQEMYMFAIVPVLLVLVTAVQLIRQQTKTQEELQQFVEAVHYRDFSRHFNVRQAPAEVQPLRQGFNEINSAFKLISNEKETQYQYLQKILELVDTGIISYNTVTGEVAWLNDALKKLLQIPYFKNISHIEKRNPALHAEIISLQPGENRVITLKLEKTDVKLLLSSSTFQTGSLQFKLIVFQNVNEAMDANEAKAWQKLLSVMTHEIMNSVAPISSLAGTLKLRLQSPELTASEAVKEDIQTGIDTIERRSEGLLKFAQAYRTLNKITSLNLKKISISDLFGHIYQLMQPTLEQKKIELDIILKEPHLQIEADQNLMEQVLINLVVNAIEAVKDADMPRITLTAATVPGKKAELRIMDNGHGMTPEVLDNIFVPFFTTKKSGSGIGLSLCKQIILLHRATIHVQSVEGTGTVFSLIF